MADYSGLSVLIALSLALAGPVQATSPSAQSLTEVELAIESGRLDQARLMISEMIRARVAQVDVDQALAHLAFASNDDEEALARYQAQLRQFPGDRMACERAGLSALRLNRLAEARPLMACATANQSSSWRAWNARGVLADLTQDWTEAASSYATALRLDPANARILNNIGYSHLLQGDWSGAIDYFERARMIDPAIERVGNNLELARAAIEQALPSRLPNENASAWAARLNDAGVAAEILGDRRRAIANFTRALEASGGWYVRAANNLAAVSAE